MTVNTSELREGTRNLEKNSDDGKGTANPDWHRELPEIHGPGTLPSGIESGTGDKMREYLDSIKKALDGTDLGQNRQPDAQDVQDAQKKLNDKITNSDTPEDQAKMKELGNELLAGNLDGFKKALNEIDDPEKKRAMVEELNKNLEGSGTRVQMDADGNVIVSKEGSNRAVKIGADGKTRVVEATTNEDGTTTMGGEVLGANAGSLFKEIGNGTVNGVLDSDESSDEASIPTNAFDEGFKLPEPIKMPGAEHSEDNGFDVSETMLEFSNRSLFIPKLEL